MRDKDRIAELERRVDELEQQMRRLLKDRGQPVRPSGEAVDPVVLDAIRAGRKIQAVKAYREQTGAGLKAAKEAVEELERRMKRGEL
ncbi:MAG: ribosomal protein L7/L12 [Anaerolineae bacterium]